MLPRWVIERGGSLDHVDTLQKRSATLSDRDLGMCLMELRDAIKTTPVQQPVLGETLAPEPKAKRTRAKPKGKGQQIAGGFQ